MRFVSSKHIRFTYITLCFLLLSNCQLSESKKTHGINFLENRTSVLEVNKTNKNDVVKIIGRPHSISTSDSNKWIYIERTLSKGKYHQLGKNVLIANNVLAHVPDINNFLKGISIILKKDGISTFEFPHLLELIKHNQYDTVYHEHFSYLSILALENIFKKNDLEIFDVQQINTHGGSLRVFAKKKGSKKFRIKTGVSRIRNLEKKYRLNSINKYKNFQKRTEKNKNELIKFLIECKRKNFKVAAFGAAAKGNTLLNYAGIRQDLISYVCDSAPSKQYKFLPGSRIPIYPPEYLLKNPPNYLLVLPWNIAHEIVKQLEILKKSKTKIFIAIPKIKIL